MEHRPNESRDHATSAELSLEVVPSGFFAHWGYISAGVNARTGQIPFALDVAWRGTLGQRNCLESLTRQKREREREGDICSVRASTPAEIHSQYARNPLGTPRWGTKATTYERDPSWGSETAWNL